MTEAEEIEAELHTRIKELEAQRKAAEEVIDLGEQFELAIGIDGCLEGGPCSLKERCKKTAPWSVSHIQKCCVELDKKRKDYRNTYGEVECMKGKDIDTAEAVVGWIREVLPFLPGEEYKALEIELPDLVLLEAYITALEAVAEAARQYIQYDHWNVYSELCHALDTLDQGSQPVSPKPAGG